MAAWIDPAVCSMVLDGERLIVALSLPFDPNSWAMAFATRALPLRVTLSVAGIVGLPLAAAVVLARASGRARGWPWWWALVLGVGLAANVWLTHLERRSEAMLAADPQRMAKAAARMHPWHEATVAEIPRHHAELRARLGLQSVD
jgi:hypothetical protein